MIVLGLVAGAALATTVTSVVTLQRYPAAFGLDLPAYTEGAHRLLETGSPYPAELRVGPIEHVATNIQIAYFYPPPLAQLFVPLLVLPQPLLAFLWATVQTVLLSRLLLAVHRAWGGRPTRLVAAVVLLAAAAFQPTQIALYIGNVSAWVSIAACAALLPHPRTRSIAGAVIAWLKVSPGGLAVGAVFDRTTTRAALIAGAVIPAVSVALSPHAWSDWLVVLPAILRTPPAATEFNLAPAYVLQSSSLGGPAIAFWLALPAAFFALTALNALRSRRIPWVASAIGLYLTLTATSWHHYFIALVPVAVAAWPAASMRMRALIVVTWLWYSLLWSAIGTTWHQLVGLVLWLALLLSLGVPPVAAEARTAIRARRRSALPTLAKG